MKREVPDRYSKVKIGTYSNGDPKYITWGLKVFYYHLNQLTGHDLTSSTMQGCYHDGALSADTHSGADIVDTPNYGVAFLNDIKELGGFGWLRTALDSPDFGGSNTHTHWGIKSSKKMAESANRQLSSYRHKDNGLIGNGDDRYPYRTAKRFAYVQAYNAMMDEIELDRQLSRAVRIRKTTRKGSPLYDTLTRFINRSRRKIKANH